MQLGTRRVYITSGKETTIDKMLNTTIKLFEVRLEEQKVFNLNRSSKTFMQRKEVANI